MTPAYTRKIAQKLPIKQLAKIFDAISSYGEVRLVGGCVRDIIFESINKAAQYESSDLRDGKSLLNHSDEAVKNQQNPPADQTSNMDYDMSTTIKPCDLIKILHSSNISARMISAKHGTVLATLDNIRCEITTLRKDVKCDGRHADVEFIDNWEEDAARRDFTINAMSMDLSWNIYDYFNGLADLKNRIVRFVGDPINRIKEDHLRILRYFRFCAYIGTSNIDQASLAAAATLSFELSSISGERIRSEFFRILSAKYAKDVVKLIFSHKVNRAIGIADINIDLLSRVHFSGDRLVDIAALIILSDSHKIDILKIADRWKLSENEKRTMISLYEQYMTYGNALCSSDIMLHKKCLYIFGEQLYKKMLSLTLVLNHQLKLDTLINLMKDQIIPTFPVDGYDIKNLGLTGKEIGDAMRHLKKLWIDSNFSISKEKLLEKAINHKENL
ncbi:hypothetical protein [Candidatus Lariskella endosymbiont of Epinotia ramella]|uniref:CCA tRNA nucleotidyltransferase n=1 Tax=Candidatus Lariskella endosymbiont of Epinotia ramella TaxID=3066224 RepID=UPI0030D39D8F